MNNYLLIFLIILCCTACGEDTLPPLDGVSAPRTLEQAWAGFDPRAEPLDVEVLKQWEHRGVILKVLRYRTGTFKGKKSMMAAVYGYPKGGNGLPGLVDIHGGGGAANWRACFNHARRGYAALSVAWTGRLHAPDYHVGVAETRLFWSGESGDPRYRVTTDWGAIDAYHEPTRRPGNNFVFNPPSEETLDPVPSPRNSGWFMNTLGIRRALTFLEQQPEVNPELLGVGGFSMGGKLAVMVAGTDDRVKAAAASCGGISDKGHQYPDEADAALVDASYLAQVACPIMFHCPANDFHAHIDDLPTAVEFIKTKNWRVSCAPHRNHRDTEEYKVNLKLWMDQHLKGGFEMPATPRTVLVLDTTNGVPRLDVFPDPSGKLLAVDVHYTQLGNVAGARASVADAITRFWRHAAPQQAGGRYAAALPLFDVDRPLWVYANVTYRLHEPGYGVDRFVLSSLVQVRSAEAFQAAGVKPTLLPSRVIETFDGDWEKEWFYYHPGIWSRQTAKLRSPQYAAPPGARLALDVRSREANTLGIILDAYGLDVALAEGSAWQTIILSPGDFRDPLDKALAGWTGVRMLKLGFNETLWANDKARTSRTYGQPWSGPAPEFRQLRWMK